MKKRLLSGLSIFVLGAMLFTGCAGGSGTETNTATTTQPEPAKQAAEPAKQEPVQSSGGRIQIVGSTTVAPPMEKLAAKYNEAYSNIVIEIQGVGSSAGVKAANEKTADIGMASRSLTADEKTWGLVETVIAYDGIGVVVHPSNGVEDLTSEQVKGIFEGKITNWSEVGGANQEIIVVTREEGSGTRGAFEEILKLTEKVGDKNVSTIAQTALVAEGNGTVKANVASKEGAVGYLSLGIIDDTVKALSVDGVAATEEEVLKDNYSISRPLLILTQPGASADVAAFIEFILSDEGQAIVSESYISVK
jgi:phosphate transport system substrate-binding protein